MGILSFLKKSEPKPEPVQVAKHKILVVEDEQYLREFYQDLLTQEGYEVFTANNGQEGLNAALGQIPDLILMDIMMPVMDGNEAIRRLSENEKTKAIPVIVLTNAGNINNMDQAKYYSVFQFVIKSNIAPEELLKTIKEGLVSKPKIQSPLNTG